MIFGEYPCCGGHLALTTPDATPQFERELCPHCRQVVWHYHSRFDPKSYTDEGFFEEYEIDPDTSRIVKKS